MESTRQAQFTKEMMKNLWVIRAQEFKYNLQMLKNNKKLSHAIHVKRTDGTNYILMRKGQFEVKYGGKKSFDLFKLEDYKAAGEKFEEEYKKHLFELNANNYEEN